ncbi:MAG: SsrA-binding protein SmpB [bacterium]
MSKQPSSSLVQNRRAFHHYSFEQRIEAGVVLVGCEVKSIRQGQANLQESYASFKEGELWLHNCHINPFKEGNRFNPEPIRPRKLLLHKKELQKLEVKLSRQPLNLIPLRLYISKNKVKIELGLGKSKKMFDKRKALKERSIDKEVRRQFKQR